VPIEEVKEVEMQLRQHGFKPFEVELGGEGVGILDRVGDSMILEFEKSVSEIVKGNQEWMYWN
jgi:hypothetical protein